MVERLCRVMVILLYRNIAVSLSPTIDFLQKGWPTLQTYRVSSVWLTDVQGGPASLQKFIAEFEDRPMSPARERHPLASGLSGSVSSAC